MTRFLKYADAGFLDSVIPILSADAVMSEDSTIDPSQRGKIPGEFKVAKQAWVGMHDWATRNFTRDDFKKWERWPECNIGIRTKTVLTVDADCNHDSTVAKLIDLFFVTLGAAPIRGRDGSARIAMPYRLADGEPSPGKLRIAFQNYGNTDKKEISAVEFLGDGQQFVVEGIHPSGARYKWRDGRDLVETTFGGLTEITLKDWNAAFEAIYAFLISEGYEIITRRKNGIGADDMPIGDERTAAKDFDEAMAALFAIPMEGMPYDLFISILHAYKAAVSGSEEFYLPFRDWALQFPSAEEGYIRSKWDSVTASSIGADKLYSIAREHGWTDGFDEFDAVPPTPNDAGADDKGTANLFTQYIYVEKQDGFYDRKSNTIVSPKTVDVRHNINSHFYKKKECASTVYLENTAKRTMAHNLTFWPGRDQVIEYEGKTLVNKWHASNAIEVSEGDITLFLNLLRKLYPDEREQNILLDKMSYSLLHPDIKPNWHCLLFSLPGAGKDSLLRPLFTFLGSNGVIVNAETLLGGFNEFAQRQQVLIGELRSFQRKSLFDKLKLYLATPPDWLTVNEKFEKLYQIPNLSTWWFTTNEPDCIAFDNTDRRLCVLRSPMTKEEIEKLEARGADGKTYFQRYHEWLNAGGAGAVIHFLRTRKLSQGFNPQGRAPWTAAKGEMVEATLTEAQRWIIEQVRDQSDDRVFQPALVTREDVLQYARNSLLPEEERKGLTLAKVSEALRAAGAIQVAKFRLGGRGTEQRRVWAIRRQEALAQYKPVELRKIYLIERVGDPAFAEFAGG